MAAFLVAGVARATLRSSGLALHPKPVRILRIRRIIRTVRQKTL
jgi:hypothetical protein